MQDSGRKCKRESERVGGETMTNCKKATRTKIERDSGRQKGRKRGERERDDARVRQREGKGRRGKGGEGGERKREGDYVRPCPKRIMR